MKRELQGAVSAAQEKRPGHEKAAEEFQVPRTIPGKLVKDGCAVEEAARRKILRKSNLLSDIDKKELAQHLFRCLPQLGKWRPRTVEFVNEIHLH